MDCNCNVYYGWKFQFITNVTGVVMNQSMFIPKYVYLLLVVGIELITLNVLQLDNPLILLLWYIRDSYLRECYFLAGRK
jgi:hypothetical protein